MHRLHEYDRHLCTPIYVARFSYVWQNTVLPDAKTYHRNTIRRSVDLFVFVHISNCFLVFKLIIDVFFWFLLPSQLCSWWFQRKYISNKSLNSHQNWALKCSMNNFKTDKNWMCCLSQNIDRKIERNYWCWHVRKVKLKSSRFSVKLFMWHNICIRIVHISQ